MSGYTKGPWKWEDSYFGLRQVSSAGGEYVLSARPYEGMALEPYPAGDEDKRKERTANARLIAAAPDLLEALEAVADTDISGSDDSVIRFILVALQHKARAAIARARGES